MVSITTSRRAFLLLPVLLALLWFALPGAEMVRSQNSSVSIMRVAGQFGGSTSDTIMTGVPIKFFLRYTNYTGFNVNVSNGFELNSPDGAVWTGARIDTLGVVGGVSTWFKPYFDLGFSIQGLGVMGVALFNGLPPGFSDSAIAISIDPLTPSNSGRHLCIDSAFFGVAGEWKWAAQSYVWTPDWRGLPAQPHYWEGYCFTIYQVPNQPPTITNCPTSLTTAYGAPIQYDFNALDAEGDPITFELVSGPGSINAATGLWSYSPSIGDIGRTLTLSVRSRDQIQPGPNCAVSLVIQGQSGPYIGVDPASLTFAGTRGCAVPEPQPFLLANIGTGSMLWSVSTGASWLSIQPPLFGSGDALVWIRPYTTNLAPGTYNGGITISGNAANAPFVLPVSYEVSDPHFELTLPASAAHLTSLPIALNWTDLECADGYKLEYSGDQLFPVGGTTTVSLLLPKVTSFDLSLPDRAMRVYWRVSALGAGRVLTTTTSRYFDYSASGTFTITSLGIMWPKMNSRYEYGLRVTSSLRLTSDYTGPIQGSWLLDGAPYAPITGSVTAAGNIQITGPALPTRSPGAHALTAKITSPNQITSSAVTFEVLPAVYGLSDRFVATAAPSFLSADGVSTSVITVTKVDEQGRRVWDDNGWTPSAIILLSGPGSVPAEVYFTDGQGSFTYTAGTSSGTAAITIMDFLQMGLATVAVDITLGESTVALLQQHDLCRQQLSSLKMDMFAFPFDGSLIPNSFNLSSAESFVAARIRGHSPSPQELEAFERLVMAEEVLSLGYHFKPSSDNLFDQTEPIGGAQELAHAGVKSSCVLVNTGLSIYLMTHAASAAASKGTAAKDGLIAEGLKTLGDKALDMAAKVLNRIVALLTSKDNETAKSIMGLVDMAKTVLNAALFESPSALTSIAETPVVTSPLAATYLGRNYCNRLQGPLDQAAAWSASHTSSVSLETARASVESKIESIRTQSAEALNRVTGYEDDYEMDYSELLTALNGFMDHISVGNFWKFWTKCMDAMSSLIGAPKLPNATAAAVEAFTAYGQTRNFILEGMGNAYGQSVEADMPQADGRTGNISATLGNPMASSLIPRTQVLYERYSYWASQARGSIIAHDTTGADLMLDSLTRSSEDWVRMSDLVSNITIAAHDSAQATVPSFDSLFENYVVRSFSASWSQIRAISGFAYFVANPTDTAYHDSSTAFLDASIAETGRAGETLLGIRQSLFMAGSVAMVNLVAASPVSPLYDQDTASIRLIASNVGSEPAVGNELTVAVDSQLILLSPSTVTLPDLAAGDSAIIVISVRTLWNPDDTSTSHSRLVTAQLSSQTALPQVSMFGVIAMRSCCTGTTGNVNTVGIVDLADLSALVSFLTGGGYRLQCVEETNVNALGIVDLSDLSALVSYLTGGGYVLPNCP